MKKETKLNIIGVIWLVFGIGAIANTLYYREAGLAPILWLCYLFMIILGTGALRKDSLLITSQLAILAIPVIFWDIDFFYYLFRGETLFNIVGYFFVPGPIIGKIISLQHLFTIPLALYSIYLIGLRRKDAWKISFIQMIAVFFISRIATDPVNNVNCVFHNCANFDFGFYYPLEWFLSSFLMILITNFLITKWFYRGK